ncbi:hypothetical protein RJ639_030950 [Escallonia herrerae]|uniref:ENTH domain-containing protein n=1 Tax=Escallonia herrerae TaxID=1293975 RepID=A0AA88X7K6_9ASTE|nr:hypothetical protein RJ639_030950 [Escallonia herrerae]
MAAGGSTQQSFRKALGALKDSATVGLAKVNSPYKELDIAIVKATNHLEVVPKEKHIRTIFDAISASRPREDVVYCIQALARRLAKTHNWAVALKALLVIHRALREVDPTIREELINYSQCRGHMLNISHFKDDSSTEAWDYSAWVRTYALYLEERLECSRILKYDVQTDRLRTKELYIPGLLEQLPSLQELLFRLLACQVMHLSILLQGFFLFCFYLVGLSTRLQTFYVVLAEHLLIQFVQPEGAARYNYLIQYAISIVAAESVKIYVAITDGTLNLVDKFFEMQRHDAVRALEIYRKAVDQAEKLSEFFEICRGLEFIRGQKYIKIEQPPESFMKAMEEYVMEAPQTLMLPCRVNSDDSGTTPKAIGDPEPILETDHKEDIKAEEESDPSVASHELPTSVHSEAVAVPQVIDLLGLDEATPEASELDEKNSLALAISNPENPSNSSNGPTMASQSSSWELALVTAPSSNEAAIAESKLAGGLDRLTLDSLYDNALTRTNQNGTYQMGEVASTPFEAVHYTHDPFNASSNVAPPIGVQMAAMESQQEAFLIQQQQQPVVGHDPTNPFGNPFLEHGVSPPPAQSENPYPGLI